MRPPPDIISILVKPIISDASGNPVIVLIDQGAYKNTDLIQKKEVSK